MTLKRMLLAGLLPLSMTANAQLQEGKKNIEKLDRCFARLMDRDVDWIKRLRQRLTKALENR